MNLEKYGIKLITSVLQWNYFRISDSDIEKFTIYAEVYQKFYPYHLNEKIILTELSINDRDIQNLERDLLLYERKLKLESII